jgi:hypothetical protein
VRDGSFTWLGEASSLLAWFADRRAAVAQDRVEKRERARLHRPAARRHLYVSILLVTAFVALVCSLPSVASDPPVDEQTLIGSWVWVRRERSAEWLMTIDTVSAHGRVSGRVQGPWDPEPRVLNALWVRGRDGRTLRLLFSYDARWNLAYLPRHDALSGPRIASDSPDHPLFHIEAYFTRVRGPLGQR